MDNEDPTSPQQPDAPHDPPPPPPSASPPLPHRPETAHPSGIPSESRNWALAAHLSALLGAWVALAFLGPLVVWLIRRDQGDSFVEHHAKEALNFNITWLLGAIVGGIAGVILLVATIGLVALVLAPVAAAFGIAWIVLTIIAAVKASNGEGYRYPLTIRFID